MARLTISSFLLVFILIAGCKKETPVLTSNLKSTDLVDLKYGSHISQSLDVYLPANRTAQTKTVIFIHGGFWVGGDKAEMSVLAKNFRDKGYATAAINYRLSHTSENFIHPAQVSDLAKAIEFIDSKAKEWNMSSGSLALVGASAGGHIALLYTYAYDPGNRVSTVISLAGPTNLLNMENASLQQAQVLHWFLGTDPQTSPAVYQQASPVSHVKSGSKPTLLLHGKLDLIVPYQQAIDLKTKLDQFGVKNKRVTYDNMGHQADLNLVPGFLAECENWLSENL
jgi:acetyl esterase/lipase